jgi:putative lipoic acid-binding regulatory protein
MTNLEDYELIFPCEYPVKVIGRDENDFTAFVIEVVTRHVPQLTHADFSMRSSGGEKYISVSVTFTAESRQQVDAMYAELGRDERVQVAF